MVFAYQLTLVCVRFRKQVTFGVDSRGSSEGGLDLLGTDLCLGFAHSSSVYLVRMRNNTNALATFLKDWEAY